MITKDNLPFVAIWLFLMVAIGVGGLVGLDSTDSKVSLPIPVMDRINLPPNGTAVIETAEAATSTVWRKLLRLRDSIAQFWSEQNAASWARLQDRYRQEATNREVEVPAESMMHQPLLVKLFQYLMDALKVTLIVALVSFSFLYLLKGIFQPRYRQERAYVRNVVKLD
ncbi:MAG: hypothetical protein OXL96_12450 [Candidatus Poribacteria bacterium]|nr:hypothetical protein [Candidatus Poribacteria bacterium]